MINITNVSISDNPVYTGSSFFVEVAVTASQWEIGQEQAWTSPGTYTFTVPDDGYYDIILIAGGAGGGGSAYYSQRTGGTKGYASGGGGARAGESYANQLLSKGDTISVAVGEGGSVGESATSTGLNAFGSDGSAGGTSSFGNLSILNNGYGEGGSVTRTGPSERGGTGGQGTGSLGANGSNGKTGSTSARTPTQGASGYLYNGASYGAGGEGSSTGVTGAAGGSGLVVVRLVSYL